MVRVHQENHIGFSNLARQVVPLLRQSGGIDDGRRGDILGGSDRRGYGDLGEDGLDLVCDEDTFDQRSDQARLASAFVATDTNPD